MKQTPGSIGLNEIVEELATALSGAPLKRSSLSQNSLEGAVKTITQDYVKNRLDPLGVGYKIWRDVAESGSQGVVPVYAFGASYAPDLAIEINDKPTVAIYCRLLKPGTRITDKIGATIGEALICSHQYPAVTVFFLYSRRSADYMHLLDREIMMDLWRSHKVRVLFR